MYKLAQALQADERRTTSNLVVGPNAHRLWTTLLAEQHNPQRDRFVVIGSPGLGKSRSAWYFVRMFIDARRSQVTAGVPMPVVVFEHRKDSFVWKFVPVKDDDADTEYHGWVCPRRRFEDVCEDCLHLPHNLFIVDAAKAEASSEDPSLLQATTVLVCSPDPVHYSEFSKAATKRYMGPGCADALVVAARFMNAPSNAIPEEEVRARVAKVGPFPRRVFSSEAFSESCALIDAAFSSSNLDLVEDVLRTGLSKYESHVRSAIKPLSTVFMLQATADCAHAQPVFVSDYARGRVGYDLAVRVHAALLSPNPYLGGMVELGTTIEFLAFRLMQSGLWTPKLLPHHQGQHPATISIRGVHGDVVLTPPPWKHVYAMIASLPTWKPRQVAPVAAPVFLGSNFPVVDAMDARNRGFQVTLGRRKHWDEATVQRLRRNLGLRGTALLHIIVVHLEGQVTGLPRRAPKHTRLYSVALPSPKAAAGMWKAALGSGAGAGAGAGDDAVDGRK